MRCICDKGVYKSIIDIAVISGYSIALRLFSDFIWRILLCG